MRIVDVETSDSAHGGLLAARVVWDDPRLEPDRVEYVYRDTPASALTNPGDCLLAAMLVPAMAVGEDVAVDAPVSAKLVDGARTIARTISTWYPKFRESRISAPVAEPPRERPTKVACLFSGGLDSFYSILRPREEPIGLLLTIIGFDLRFEKRAAVPVVLPRLKRAAESLGLPIVVVDSNAYEIGHKYLFRAEHHGGFLASIALALGTAVGRCFIPSSWAQDDRRPWGSHPDTDPLWSTEALEFVHDGSEFTRLDKAVAVSADPIVLEQLRVCVRRPELYNCRRCSKCVATTLILHAAGTLDASTTLGPLDIGLVRRTPISADYHRSVADYALRRIDDPELHAAVRRALALGRLSRAFEPVIERLRRRRLRSRLEHAGIV